MPRVKLFNQEEALAKAMGLFWETGYASTSLSDLIKHLGISKGSFYDTFKSKRELFDKAIEQYRVVSLSGLEIMLASEEDRKKGVKSLFKHAIEGAFNDEKKRGCMIVNVCSEMGSKDDEIRKVLQMHNKEFFKIINDYLKGGNLNVSTDLKSLTNLIITQLTGINIEVKFRKTKVEMINSTNLIVGLVR